MVVLSESLRRRGHEVTAVCPPGGWITRELSAAGVPTLGWPVHGLRASATVLRLRRYALDHDIAVIHTHLTRATYMGYIAGLLARKPVVSTMHTLNRDWAYRYLPHARHWFVAVSRDLQQAMIRCGAPAERVRAIYNGTDMNPPAEDPTVIARAVRAELDLPPDACIIGVFGRVDEFKGQHILAQALPTIVQERSNAYLVLVGQAEPAMQERLWDIARRGGVADRLRLLGVRDDVARLMAATDIVALTSVIESFGMVIIEAMAMGKPVVATRAGGIPEIVVEGETGLLIDRKPEAAATALKRLCGDYQARIAMGRAGRERAASLFTADRMAAEIESFYMEITGGSA